MAYVDFLTKIHKKTERDYLERVVKHDKAKCAEAAIKFDYDYWDGDRSTGYGGYKYDGRWRVVADEMIQYYGLTADSRILDVGCGKAFLLYEFTQALPGVTVAGIDISEYALANAKEEVRGALQPANASKLPFEDGSFNFVYSITTLHNLYIYDLWNALKEIERVSAAHKYINVEAYRNEQEKVNLMYWQLTCRAFHTPGEWEWIFEQTGYTGDHSFIYFE